MMRRMLALAALLAVSGISVATAGADSVPAETPRNAKLHWPGFRGPTGNGVAGPLAKPLVKVDPAKHTIWKTPLKAKGFSSPIICGDRIYLTAEGERILAFDRKTGKPLWDTTLKTPPLPPLGEDEDEFAPGEAGTASPTPCTDGKRVYAFFGTGVFGCVDLSGKQLWVKRLVARPRNPYGLASSPVFDPASGAVIQQVDLEADEEGDEPEFKSFIVAFRGSDGRQLWRKARKTYPAWSTPLLQRRGKVQVLYTTAEPYVIACNAATGVELWRVKGMIGDVAGSPIIAGGVLFAMNSPSGQMFAIRLGGSGNVTKTHIAWRYDDALPDTASAVCDGKRHIHMGDSGELHALDVKTGKLLWMKEFDGIYYASPVLSGANLYLMDTEGMLTVLESATGKIVHSITLGEEINASPAIAGANIYVRTAKHLLCLGAKAK